MGFDYRISTGLGKTDSSLSKQNLCTKTRGKGAVTSQETEPDPLASVGVSPVEAWVGICLPQGWGAGSRSPARDPLA